MSWWRPGETRRRLLAAEKQVLAAEKQVMDARKSAKLANYQAASVSARWRSWMATSADANSTLYSDLREMQKRARDLERNAQPVATAVRELVTSLVSTGMRPLVSFPGRQRDSARAASADLKRAWYEWGIDARTSSDATVDATIAQAVRAMILDGESFVRARPRRPEDGLTVPLQVQVLESDMLDLSYSEALDGGRKIVMGIEFDAVGRRLAYHFWKSHPGNSIDPAQGYSGERVRVPADEVAHVVDTTQMRPGQVRGIPWIHAILTSVREIHVTEDALRVQLQLAADIAGAIESPTVLQPGDDGEFGPVDSDDDSSGREVQEAVPGTVLRLQPGESWKSYVATAPQGVPDYLRSAYHQLAAGMRVTYEQMTGDLSQVNFSSARMGRVNHQAAMDQIRALAIEPLLMRLLWRWFVRQGQLSRVIPLDYDYRNVRWVARSPHGIDPVKDASAAAMRLASSLTSLDEEIEAIGGDYLETLDRIAAVQADLAERGIQPDWAQIAIAAASASDSSGTADD